MYLLTPPSFSILRCFLICDRTSGEVLPEKEIDDFAVLIIWPEAFSYPLRILISVAQLWGSVLVENMVLSANNRLLILGLLFETLIPTIVPLTSAFFAEAWKDLSTQDKDIWRERVPLAYPKFRDHTPRHFIIDQEWVFNCGDALHDQAGPGSGKA